MSKKTILAVIAVILVVFGVVMAVCKPNLNPPAPPADDLVGSAIESLLSHESLSYHSENSLIIGEKVTEIGVIDGEIFGENYHAQGESLGSPLNIYYVDGKTYRQDVINDQWTVVDGEILEQSQSLLNEVEPRMALILTEIINVVSLEDEPVDEEDCYKISFEPVTSVGYYETFFDGLNCILWITKDDQEIRKMELTGTSSTNGIESVLLVECEFWNWGVGEEIQAPIFD